ncbi:YceD family protein [Tsuneonella sp. HG249]
MNEPEFSRVVRARPQPPEHLSISAEESERTGLAARFGVVAIDALEAELRFEPSGDAVVAKGRLTADLVQNCAVSREDFPTRVDESLDLRFVPAGSIETTEEEIELASDEPDVIEFEGDSFDLGEAVAQSLGLAIDPYAEGPAADEARRRAGIVDDAAPRGPLGEALAKLTKS